ncbi:MAG: integrase core domain-containing protein [Verrucomicrobiota bacterium]
MRVGTAEAGHPHWGPRKIRELYQRLHRGAEVPSESSFKRVLEKAGLTEPRRTRVARAGGRLAQGLRAEAPNEVWSVDFKGWWRDRSGARVEPLSVRDEHSRMILELRAVPDARTETVRARFEELFRRHGLPGAIRSDNGPPFASAQGLLGLSRLSVWWLALGIQLERSRPGCPQDNGAHERMHLDVRRELQAGRIGDSEAAFEQWRQEFNTERPHEALGMKTPAEVYRPSPRSFEGLRRLWTTRDERSGACWRTGRSAFMVTGSTSAEHWRDGTWGWAISTGNGSSCGSPTCCWAT